MTKRVYNFYAGPATLPLPVLKKAQEELLDFQGTGMSILEISHRSKEYDAVSDGITEEIITAVSRFKRLLVIARNASLTMRGREADALRVGAELGAEYLLQGSIRRAGERVRVSAQLVEAGTGTQLWAERYDSTLSDVLELQDEIAGRIVGAVAPHIGEAEIERARQPGRKFSRSYDLALQALARSDEARRSSDAARMQEALDLARDAARSEPVSPRAFHAVALASLRLADLQNFVNGWLAEPWKQVLEKPSELQIRARISDYKRSEITENIIALTAGIDVKQIGFFYRVWGWCVDRKAYLIDYGFLITWDDVYNLCFPKEYLKVKTGLTMKIYRAAIDTGGRMAEEGWARTGEIYDWLRQHSRGLIFGVKGLGRTRVGE